MPGIAFVDPSTGEQLHRVGNQLTGIESGRVAAEIRAGIPRFVTSDDDYATSFGWQWAKWDLLSDAERAGTAKLDLLTERTLFTPATLEGRSVLECGCGRGDDTEVLLSFPVAELHAFDLSSAVDVAAEHLGDDRLQLSQASITEIPYPDESFDVVFCHRVLQHTPDPVRSLRSICRKVKPGGVLFAHSYKRSFRYMNKYKYKYRPLTRRLPVRRISGLLDRHAERLYRLHERTHDSGFLVDALIHGFVPFERMSQYGAFDRGEMIELSKLVTFDALTPRYDRPMTSRTFRSVIEGEGFVFEHLHDPKVSPIYGTARRTGSGHRSG